MPQLLPSSARRPLEDICAILGALLPTAIADMTVPKTCSYASGPYFALARADAVALTNIRFKLNSTAGQEPQDLAALSTLIADFHNRLGWPRPTDFLAASTDGRATSCQLGILAYRFSRERGVVPRFNAVLRIDAAAGLSHEHFAHATPVCLQ